VLHLFFFSLFEAQKNQRFNGLVMFSPLEVSISSIKKISELSLLVEFVSRTTRSKTCPLDHENILVGG
jgi:hypothetical protein